MRKLLLALAAALTMATPALADMDGPCNAFNGLPVITNFQAGSFHLKGKDVNAQVNVIRNKNGTYTFASGPEKGILTLYSSKGVNILRTQDVKTKRCVYGIATRKGDGLVVYSAFKTSMAVSSKYGQPKFVPIAALPFKKRSQNVALFRDMARHIRASDVLFTATRNADSNR